MVRRVRLRLVCSGSAQPSWPATRGETVEGMREAHEWREVSVDVLVIELEERVVESVVKLPCGWSPSWA